MKNMDINIEIYNFVFFSVIFPGMLLLSYRYRNDIRNQKNEEKKMKRKEMKRKEVKKEV